MLRWAPQTDPLSENARDQIVRVCRTTLGDELRSVGYVTREYREWLYVRNDVTMHAEPSLPIPQWFDDQEACSGSDAFSVLVFANESDCAVFIGPADESVSRCNGTSLKNYGEVEAAVTEIVRTECPS